MNVLSTQKRLRELGFDPGPIDGIRGRRTIGAIKRFQAANGLEADGIVGPLTTRIMWPKTTAQSDADSTQPWMAEAKRLIGTIEGAGSANNPTIMDWADDLDIWYPDDNTAWCGLFVAQCIASQLPEEPLPDSPLGARNWLKFGRESKPVRGSVLVFWRGSKKGWKGHVGFYSSEDNSTYHVLGGNQSNSVSIARISKDRLLGARWPLTASNTGDRQMADLSGKISTNEA